MHWSILWAGFTWAWSTSELDFTEAVKFLGIFPHETTKKCKFY